MRIDRGSVNWGQVLSDRVIVSMKRISDVVGVSSVVRLSHLEVRSMYLSDMSHLMGGQVANEGIMEGRSVVLSLGNNSSVVRSSWNKRKRAHSTSNVGSLVNRKADSCLDDWSCCVVDIMDWETSDSFMYWRVMNDVLIGGHDFLDSVSVQGSDIVVINMGHFVNNRSTVESVLVSICDDMGFFVINSWVVLVDYNVFVRVRVLDVVLVIVVRLS